MEGEEKKTYVAFIFLKYITLNTHHHPYYDMAVYWTGYIKASDVRRHPAVLKTVII